jgi:hypothetical protein
MEPVRPIDIRLGREVDRVTPPVRLKPQERDAERERREQARKKRQQAYQQPPEGGISDDGHVDLRA